MATKIKDAAVVTSKYKSNGQEKSRWQNVGAVYKKDDGSLFLSLDAFFNFSALPRNEGSDRVIIGLFDPKKRDDYQGTYGGNTSNGNNRSSASNSNQDYQDSGIPF